MNKICSQTDTRHSAIHNRRDLDIENIEETTNVIHSNNKFLKPNSFKNITENMITSFRTKSL